MSFADFFVPKYLHSNPKVRIKFVNKTTDLTLLKSITEKDSDKDVIKAAKNRIQSLTAEQQTA